MAVVVTNKAFLCFWLLTLLALSSEDVGVSDADCILIFHPFCKHDGDCDGPCEKEADPDAGYNNIRGKCVDWSCFCCPPAHHHQAHDDHHGHNARKLAR